MSQKLIKYKTKKNDKNELDIILLPIENMQLFIGSISLDEYENKNYLEKWIEKKIQILKLSL